MKLTYRPTPHYNMPLPEELDTLHHPYGVAPEAVYGMNTLQPYLHAEPMFCVTNPTPFVTFDALSAQLPETEKGLVVRDWVTTPLADDNHLILYFLCAHAPTQCVGFAVLRYDLIGWEEEDSPDMVDVDASLVMIYVLPAFRGNGNGSVIAASAGYLLGEQIVASPELCRDSVERVNTAVYGQGVTFGGRACLERFHDGLAFHLSGQIIPMAEDGVALPARYGQIELQDEGDIDELSAVS